MKWRKGWVWLSLCLVFFVPLFSSEVLLRMGDVPRIMDRLMSLHIENREWSVPLMQRTMKLYVEQFDYDKVYLLESEVGPYLNMSEARALQVIERVKRQDYSDFLELNGVIQGAILRAEAMRSHLGESILADEGGVSNRLPPPFSFSRYAVSEDELKERQKVRMARFYLYHRVHSHLDTLERKQKVFSLYEKKVRRGEYNYLFFAADGALLAKNVVENLMAVHILKAFARSLDTHTSFFSPEEAHEMRLSLEKQFDGVGVVLSEGIDGIMIADLIRGSPAEESGQIHVNDYLVDVDGSAIGELSFEEVLDLLKRKDRREILLGFKRFEGELVSGRYFQVFLVKRPIVMKDERIQVGVEPVEGGIIGKIALYSFYESSDGVSSERDMKEAIRQLQKRGELRGLVLDLRENSGGFLSQAVRVTGLFVANGVIVISKYGHGDLHFLRNVMGRKFFSGPLVILTSKMSASAAEIVAQALQDYGVAVVVGDERTFGKGSIQYQTITDMKADMFYKVTVGRYYTVSGKSTQIDGVIADIVVPTHYAPYNIGEKFLEYPLSADRVEPAYLDPLSDLDERMQKVFQVRYLPFLQRVVPFWKRVLPALRESSAKRLASSPEFQAFLKKQERVRERAQALPVNTIDEPVQSSLDDLQAREAVNIVKDMIQVAEAHSSAAAVLSTGTEG